MKGKKSVKRKIYSLPHIGDLIVNYISYNNSKKVGYVIDIKEKEYYIKWDTGKIVNYHHTKILAYLEFHIFILKKVKNRS